MSGSLIITGTILPQDTGFVESVILQLQENVLNAAVFFVVYTAVLLMTSRVTLGSDTFLFYDPARFLLKT